MPPSSFARRHIDHVTSKTDAMLAAAGVTGIEIHNLSEIRQRLAAHETERASLPPSRRRAELDGIIARDLADLCEWYRRRVTVGERRPAA